MFTEKSVQVIRCFMEILLIKMKSVLFLKIKREKQVYSVRTQTFRHRFKSLLKLFFNYLFSFPTL